MLVSELNIYCVICAHMGIQSQFSFQNFCNSVSLVHKPCGGEKTGVFGRQPYNRTNFVTPIEEWVGGKNFSPS